MEKYESLVVNVFFDLVLFEQLIANRKLNNKIYFILWFGLYCSSNECQRVCIWKVAFKYPLTSLIGFTFIKKQKILVIEKSSYFLYALLGLVIWKFP